jgi:ELWxxDGT repeat protein
MVKDIRPGSKGSGPICLTSVGGSLLFVAYDGIHGDELWRSDGTEAGTVMVRDIRPGSKGAIRFCYDGLTPWAGEVYFAANDGRHGDELWKSDGTSGGTTMVADLRTGPHGSSPWGLEVVGPRLLFQIRDRRGTSLWGTDGTTAGTKLVRLLVGLSTWRVGTARGTLYLSVTSTVDGGQLWKSDGTSAGTVLVKDFTPWPRSCPADELTAFDGSLYFNVGIREYGEELWRSDGTAAGTRIVKDTWPGPEKWPAFDEFCQYGPRGLTAVAGSLYFSTNDGKHGTELWRSDGTKAGTSMTKDIRPGQDGGLSDSPRFAGIGRTIYFAASASTDPAQLWRSDGTVAGTEMVREFMSSDIDPPLGDLVSGNGRVFFWADDGVDGAELWSSDGTTEGTEVVSDINPGSAGSGPWDLVFVRA